MKITSEYPGLVRRNNGDYTREQLLKMMDEHGNLNLSNTQITALPDGLVVGRSLYLSGTNITALPDGLTVGGLLVISGTKIKDTSNVKRLEEGCYIPGKYLYADGILTHIKRSKKIGKYTYYLGKFKNKNVIFDGKNYAHCKDFESGVRDLEYKAAKDRGAEQYKRLTVDSVVSRDDAVVMYRVITGACQAGTQGFLNSLKEIKDSYTIREIIDLTKGQYGARTFEEFFKNKDGCK